jgi:hypothetical protein
LCTIFFTAEKEAEEEKRKEYQIFVKASRLTSETDIAIQERKKKKLFFFNF